MNRKLFRPTLTELKEPVNNTPRSHANGPQPHKKPAPPEQTHAENFYWIKQMQARTPVVVILGDGETLHGTVEWYDRDCIKLTRNGSPNFRPPALIRQELVAMRAPVIGVTANRRELGCLNEAAKVVRWIAPRDPLGVAITSSRPSATSARRTSRASPSG